MNSFVVVVVDSDGVAVVALRTQVVVLALAFLAFAPPPSMLHLKLYFRLICLLLITRLLFTYYTQTNV